MNRQLPSWAAAAKKKRRKTTWPHDLRRVATVFRWGRPTPTPKGAPKAVSKPRSKRRRVTANPYLPFLHLRYVVQVSGLDEVAGIQGTYVITSNHSSLLDASILRSALPLAWRISTKDREIALAAGRSVLVFPEGAPSPDGTLGSFDDGPAELASYYNLPVVPVGITGTFNLKALLRIRGLKSRPVVRVRVGSPIYPRSMAIATASRQIRAAVADLVAEDGESWWSSKRRTLAPAAEAPQVVGWRRNWYQSGRNATPQPARRIWDTAASSRQDQPGRQDS